MTRLVGPLDIPALERALGEIMRRHEALRTRFVIKGGQPFQMVNPHEPFTLAMTDLSALDASEREAEVHRVAARGDRHPVRPLEGAADARAPYPPLG